MRNVACVYDKKKKYFTEVIPRAYCSFLSSILHRKMGLLSKAYKRVLKRINDDSDTSTGANIFKRGTLDLSNEETINMERDFHNEQSSTYWLPKDPTEQQRLTGVRLE